MAVTMSGQVASSLRRRGECSRRLRVPFLSHLMKKVEASIETCGSFPSLFAQTPQSNGWVKGVCCLNLFPDLGYTSNSRRLSAQRNVSANISEQTDEAKKQTRMLISSVNKCQPFPSVTQSLLTCKDISVPSNSRHQYVNRIPHLSQIDHAWFIQSLHSSFIKI
jgi:hypothetical protein